MKCPLEEILREIGEIPTLELIKIDGIWNRPLVESLKRIQGVQHDAGNYDLQVTVDGIE